MKDARLAPVPVATTRATLPRRNCFEKCTLLGSLTPHECANLERRLP